MSFLNLSQDGPDEGNKEWHQSLTQTLSGAWGTLSGTTSPRAPPRNPSSNLPTLNGTSKTPSESPSNLGSAGQEGGKEAEAALEELRSRIERLEKAASTKLQLSKLFGPGGEYDEKPNKEPSGGANDKGKEEDETPEGLELGPEQPAKPGCCGFVLKKMWGGPVIPRRSDTVGSWVENFFGGVTTAHGINRVFDGDSGMCRKFFWMALFLTGLGILGWSLTGTFQAYLDAETATSITFRDGSSDLPMVSVCNRSPIRCGCEAFYDPSVPLESALPFLCAEAIAYKEAYSGNVDKNGDATGYDTLENAAAVIDMTKTEELRLAYAKKLGCDNGETTKAVVVQAAKDKKLTTQMLLDYAAFHDRSKIVRYCKTSDVATGLGTTCMGDEYWSEPWYSAENGACHTFNPCHGIPIGDKCESDADCAHVTKTRGQGGKCNSEGRCTCDLCKAGSGCKPAVQLKAGAGKGVRFILNVAVDQDAAIKSAVSSRWATGAVVHMHTAHDATALAAAVAASPGRATDIVLGQEVTIKKPFPFSSCTTVNEVDPEVCEAACLAREQTKQCCKDSSGNAIEVPSVVAGVMDPISVKSPGGTDVNLTSPVLACNELDPDVRKCFLRQTQKLAEGLICLHGAAAQHDKYYFIMTKTNSDGTAKTMYHASHDADNNGVSDQEEEMNKIENHCVWSATDMGSKPEPNHGLPCSALGEKSADCPSRTGKDDRRGKCVEASRAYCPSRCDESKYVVKSSSRNPLSEGTIKLIASEELATVTFDNEKNPSTAVRRWKPRCASTATPAPASSTNSSNSTSTSSPANTDPTCFTDKDAQQLVAENYAMINVDFDSFDETVYEKSEAIDDVTLLGTLGGNLGMWVGMSIMTISEWIELLFFAMISFPFFFMGKKNMPHIMEDEEPAEEGGEEAVAEEGGVDEDVARVLQRIKNLTDGKKKLDIKMD